MADCTKCASSTSCERVWKGMSNPMCVGYLLFDQNMELSEKVKKLEAQRAEDMFEIARLHRQIDALIDHWW